MVNQVLKDIDEKGCKMSTFKSKNCDIYTEYVWKRSLINYDDKRYWLDSIYSLPYGHPLIEEYVAGKVTLTEMINKIKGNDNYNYELNAQKFDIIKKEQERIDKEVMNSITPTVEGLDKKCKTNMTQEIVEKVLENELAKKLLEQLQVEEYESF